MRTRTKILALVISVAVIAVAVVLTVILVDTNDLPDISKAYGTVEYGGQTYKFAPYRVNVLVMGVDTRGSTGAGDSEADPGLADFLFLLSYDVKNNECTAIHINRDTYTDVPMYGVDGLYLGTSEMQIALAHQYGDEPEKSALNTANAVSMLLDRVRIDYYVSLNMDSIKVINDFFGGIEVTVRDDFTAIDPAMKAGERIKLNGKQAELYVRGRAGVGDQTNLSRMERQRDYLDSLSDCLLAMDANRAEDLAKQLNEYMVTNCPANVMSRFFEENTGIQIHPILSIPGEAQLVEGYIRYYPDEDALQKLIVDCLCVKTA